MGTAKGTVPWNAGKGAGRLSEINADLLAALKALLHDYDQLIGDGVVIENQPDERRAAVAAIAKAEA